MSQQDAIDLIKSKFIRLMFGVIEEGELPDIDNLDRLNLFVNIMNSNLKNEIGLNNNIDPEIVVSQIEVFLDKIIKVE